MTARMWATAAAFVLLIVLIARVRHHDPCSMSWRIGKVDPRFHIGKDEASTAAEAAAGIWNAAAQKNLLRFDRTGGVPINLIYDDRQGALESDRAQHEEIDRLAAEIQNLKASFASNPSQAAADRINNAVQRHNDLVTVYNRSGAREVEQGSFERVVETRGKRIVGESHKSISVYQFRDPVDLELVIAHEFGHALGIDHVSEAGAIMNESHTYNAAAPVQVHDADLRALQQKCR